MTSLWKFNSQEANEKECENGIGDGGILIHADTEDDALNILYKKSKEDESFSYRHLPEFGHNDDLILWENYTQKEWINKLKSIMNESSTYAFLVKFPSHKILK